MFDLRHMSNSRYMFDLNLKYNQKYILDLSPMSNPSTIINFKYMSDLSFMYNPWDLQQSGPTPTKALFWIPCILFSKNQGCQRPKMMHHF